MLTTNNMTFARPKSQAALRLILSLCATGDGVTRQHVELAASVDRRTARSYLNHLHNTGQIHISCWTRDGLGQFYPIPVYVAGPGVDAPKPERLTGHERQKRAWAKIKADPERHEKLKERKRKTEVKKPTVWDWKGMPSIYTRKAA